MALVALVMPSGCLKLLDFAEALVLSPIEWSLPCLNSLNQGSLGTLYLLQVLDPSLEQSIIPMLM